jgi:hypothetical protein
MARKLAPRSMKAGLVTRVVTSVMQQHDDIHVVVGNELSDFNSGRAKRRSGIDMAGQGARNRKKSVDQSRRIASYGCVLVQG